MLRHGTFGGILIAFTAILGCTRPEELDLKPTGDLKYDRARDECFYEASKAIYLAPPHTATGAKDIYAQCLKLKGYGR
ncbi:hypothetical protein DES45_105248 [Microvirga subterranea]|uniref:Lipoprotein n=1 Tax=Microvirga subterranea TaxID=186651 RepID=A0A370HKQ4_9HYPH|nr:hypothetical protein DES45_105248 [Microvirga subterranea]